MYIRIFKELTKIINIHVHLDNKLLLKYLYGDLMKLLYFIYLGYSNFRRVKCHRCTITYRTTT